MEQSKKEKKKENNLSAENMDGFVEGLNKMSHKDRMRAVHTHASPALVIAALTKEEPTHKNVANWYLAISLAAKIKDKDTITRALYSHSTLVSSEAAKFAFGGLSEQDLLEVFFSNKISDNSRALIIKSIASKNARSVGQHLYEKLKGKSEAVKLLGLCDETTLLNDLPSIPYFQINWKRVVSNHAGVLVKYFSDLLKQTTQSNKVSFYNMYSSPLTLLIKSPARDELCKVIFANLPDNAVPLCIASNFGVLIRNHPQEMVKLYSNPNLRQNSLDFKAKHLRNLTEQQQKEVISRFKQTPYIVGAIMTELPYDKNEKIFNFVYDNKPLTTEEVPQAILEYLPTKIRIREVKRMMELPRIKSDPSAKENLAKYLDVESGKEILVPVTKRSDANARAVGWQNLIDLYGNNMANLSEILQLMVTRLKNEQDPVRNPAIHSFSKLPVSLFTEDLIPNIRVLTSIVLEAQDVSNKNVLARVLERFIRNGMQQKSDSLISSGINLLKEFAIKEGRVYLTRECVPKGKEDLIVDTFTSLIDERMKAGDTTMLKNIGSALGDKATKVENFQALIAKAIQQTHAVWAFDYYLKSSNTKVERAVKLFNEDPSTVTIGKVYETLANNNAELLEPLLNRNYVLKGKYVTGEPRHFIFPTAVASKRWTTKQQELFKNDLIAEIKLHPSDLNTQKNCLQKLVTIPATSVEDLSPFLSAEANVSNMALSLVKDLDDKYPAIEILLKNLDNDNAKIAMYALGKVVKSVSLEKSSETLGRVVKEAKKVTVVKESIRLMIKLNLPGTLDHMKNILNMEKVHKDVRLTIAGSMVNFLHTEDSWKILNDVIQNDDPDNSVVSGVTHSPYMVPPIYQQRYGKMLLSMAKSKNLTVRRVVLSNISRWTLILPTELAELASEIIMDFKELHMVDTAISSLLIPATEAKHSSFLFDTCKSLLSHKISDEENGDLTQDLPSLRRLQKIMNSLQSRQLASIAELKPIILQLSDLCKNDSRCWGYYVACRLMTIDWKSEPKQVIATLRELEAQSKDYYHFDSLVSKYESVANLNKNYLAEIQEITEGLCVVPDGLALKSVLLLSRLERAWKEHTVNMLKNIRRNAVDENTKNLAYNVFIN